MTWLDDCSEPGLSGDEWFQEMMMKLASVASMMSEQSPTSTIAAPGDVVEIGILLPANWAADLIQIARSRQQSVGQMLRKLIDQELATCRNLG